MFVETGYDNMVLYVQMSEDDTEPPTPVIGRGRHRIYIARVGLPYDTV
jgi:hypothetical protein